MTHELYGRPTELVAALARSARAPVDDTLLLALAFLVKNRLAVAAPFGVGLPVLAQAPAGRALLAAAEAQLARAYSGELADPTGGALFLHRHDEAPFWAAPLKATALIGPYLFLAAPAATCDGARDVRAGFPRAAPLSLHP